MGELINLGDDLLVGAEAIARELKWTTPRGGWNTRRVYYLAEQGNVPIHNVRGLGLCARKSSLAKYFEKLDEPFLFSVEAATRQP